MQHEIVNKITGIDEEKVEKKKKSIFMKED